MSALIILLATIACGYLGLCALLVAVGWFLIAWMDMGRIQAFHTGAMAVLALAGMGLLWLASSLGAVA